MSVQLRSDQVTGITLVENATDAANKDYVDTAYFSLGTPSIVANGNGFLKTDGSNLSWEPIQGFQEYTTAGNYTFNVPTHAMEFFIEATGAGGGGASALATTSTTYVNRAEFWFLRTSGTANNFYGNANVGNPLGAYGLGFYVIGSGEGSIHASTDSITWVTRTSGFGSSIIWTLNYGSSIFISSCISATSTGKPLNTSTDTIHWTLRTSGSIASIVSTISTDNNLHLYGDLNGQVRSSTDGITWNTRTVPTASINVLYTNAYSYSSPNYVFAGNTAIIASTDGITWILRTSGRGAITYYCGTYGNGTYILGSSQGVLIASTDSIVWSARTFGTGSANQMSNLLFGNGIFIGTQANLFLRTSTDSIVWSIRSSPSQNFNYRMGIYGNSTFLLGAVAGTIIASPIPNATAGSGGGGGATVASKISRSNISGSTLTVNVGSGGTAGTAGAATTISWTSPGGNFSITANGGSAGVNTISSLTNLIPGGAGGTVLTSNNYLYSSAGTDGGNGGYFESLPTGMQGLQGSDATSATLAYQTSGGGGGVSSLFDGQFGNFGGTINYYNNTYQNSKTIPALMDGTSSSLIGGLSYGNGGNGGGAQHGAVAWVVRTSGFGATAYGITYGGGIYILCGHTGRLFTSTDSISWTLRTSGFGTSSINGIIFGAVNFVALSDGGAIRASTNGILWQTRTSSTTVNLGGLSNASPGAIYANNLYLVGGNTAGGNSVYVVSTDSIVWTLRTTGLGYVNTWSVVYGSDLTEKYIISSSSALASSTDTITWILRTSGFNLNSLNYFDGKYYGFSNGGQIRTSTNGIQWSTQVIVAHALYSSAVSNNSLVTGGASGSVYSSTNGISWILRTSGIITNAFAFGYVNGLFLGTYGSGSTVIVADPNINGGNGGSATRGGGGGGGGYSLATNSVGTGGTGGDGYVRISWQ